MYIKINIGHCILCLVVNNYWKYSCYYYLKYILILIILFIITVEVNMTHWLKQVLQLM